MAAYYLWIKAFHVIAVIAWYAGLFYIFRLYVYHVQKRGEPSVTATLEVMERRLLRGGRAGVGNDLRLHQRA